ncbi:MAG: cbb3-type cytochrome oxidase assembly protein CcoS [Halofilum sp. (in: g-proteobacteria)]|nr:cbb3-type cytochrome oxidase assembly protein CcoS [Halofilum sp. (in: g-proteobacteria)]
MESLFVLIPLTLVLLVVAVGAFFWAVASGQFDDLDTPRYRILMDDRPRRADDRAHDPPGADAAQQQGSDRHPSRR